jgi:hypothetical protein
VFWACVVIGWTGIVFALQGIVRASTETNPVAFFRLVIGLNVANDALAMPLAVLMGFAVRRFAPRWLAPPLQVGFFVSAAVLLFALPLLVGAGRSGRAGYSRLPLDYSHGVLAVLGFVWTCCAAWALASWLGRRSTG